MYCAGFNRRGLEKRSSRESHKLFMSLRTLIVEMPYKDPEKQKEAQARLSAAYYQKNKKKMKVRAKQYTYEHRERLKQFLIEIKSAPCMDCGNSFPSCVMDFDHREGEEKNGCVSVMVNRALSLDRIKQEVSKCDLVCANCHRIRTSTRKQALVG